MTISSRVTKAHATKSDPKYSFLIETPLDSNLIKIKRKLHNKLSSFRETKTIELIHHYLNGNISTPDDLIVMMRNNSLYSDWIDDVVDQWKSDGLSLSSVLVESQEYGIKDKTYIKLYFAVVSSNEVKYILDKEVEDIFSKSLENIEAKLKENKDCIVENKAVLLDIPFSSIAKDAFDSTVIFSPLWEKYKKKLDDEGLQLVSYGFQNSCSITWSVKLKI